MPKGSPANLIGTILVASVVVVLLFTGCKRDEENGSSLNPTIEFRTDSSYTFRNDTLGVSDTILVGVLIRKGDDRLRTFKVLSTYDNADPLTTDSFNMTEDTLAFDKTIITRSQAGIEKWTFWVQENDGDVIKRSLTFTVQ